LDKKEIKPIAARYAKLGFTLYATPGTAKILEDADMKVISISKKTQDEENWLDILESTDISYIISTSAKGRNPERDSVKLRRKACRLQIPCFTSLDTAWAVAESLSSSYTQNNMEIVDINHPETKL
jgi:carbamoyl-phosphate synthase large subunit